MASDGTQILMFHRIVDDVPTAFGLPGCARIRGTALTFDELSRVLDDVGPVVPLAEVEAALAEGSAPPAGSVLTFDDGYREHLDVVAPALVARGATATFYVATGLHGGGRDVAVVDAWYWLLDHAERAEAAAPLPGGGWVRGRVDTIAGKAAWVSGSPKAALLAAPVAHQAAMLGALAEAVGCALPSDLAARLYLRPEEWRQLVALGMRVGAHSVSHPRLTQVDDDALRDEVARSVAAAAALGGAVAFAYPDGAFDDRVVAAVLRAGVSSAVTCVGGAISARTDGLRLPRVFVSRTGPGAGLVMGNCPPRATGASHADRGHA